MSRQLETTISEAATRNLSVTATLEWLADMELEARNHRAIERRFKCSRLQAQPCIDAFHFHHHKTRSQNKNRILRLLDLELSAQGHQPCVHRESRSCDIVSHLIRYLKTMDLRPARIELTGRELVS